MFSLASPAARERLLIFACALVLRIVSGALFFGSVDVVNSARNSLTLMAGNGITLPYFPTANALVWFGGVLAAAIPKLVPLGFKFIPIFFDSLLAVLIRDIVATNHPGLGFRAGLLYAASPVAVLITSFHGQSDAMALFFLLLAFAVRSQDDPSERREVLAGALFAISLLIKPIALPFVLLWLPIRQAHDNRPKWMAPAGMLVAFVAALSVGQIFRSPWLAATVRLGLYSVRGVQIFGLPFAPGFSPLALQDFRLYWMVPAMAALAFFHYFRGLAAIDAMLLFYLVSLATCGLAPQYLLWPVPLLIVTARFRLASLYTVVAVTFLVLYYAAPRSSFIPFENLGVFAPLREFNWLAPPRVLSLPQLLPVVRILGNLVLPAISLIVAIVVWRIPASQSDGGLGTTKISLRTTFSYASSVLLLGIAMLLTARIFNPVRVQSNLAAAWDAVTAHYSLHIRVDDPRVPFEPDAVRGSPVNIIVLLTLGTGIWCATAARRVPRFVVDRGARREKSEPKNDLREMKEVEDRRK